MVETYWEELFPSIGRHGARAGAVDWLVHLGPPLVAHEPIEADASAVIAAWDALDGLARGLSAKLTNGQVALEVLFRALQPHYERANEAIASAAEHAAVEAMQAAGQG